MSDKPLAIDLYAGLGGWTEGLLAEGYRVVGFDNERHVYGDERYPAQLVIQDVLTIHGRQFKDAALIVASPPCQAYSYRAMPWKRAKALPPPDNALFEACFRIQREACEAAGRHIPMVVENVRGAQPYVGRSRYHFGSFHLWGDVPALLPITKRHAIKNDGGSWFAKAHNTTSGKGQNPVGRRTTRNDPRDGVKHHGSGAVWFDTGPASRSSRSNTRKQASAMIAKIPLVLSRHIARAWLPALEGVARAEKEPGGID